MSKKLKLNLNKETISNLQAKQVFGGYEDESGDICQTVISAPCRCNNTILNSVNNECNWSKGLTTSAAPNAC